MELQQWLLGFCGLKFMIFYTVLGTSAYYHICSDFISIPRSLDLKNSKEYTRTRKSADFHIYIFEKIKQMIRSEGKL